MNSLLEKIRHAMSERYWCIAVRRDAEQPYYKKNNTEGFRLLLKKSLITLADPFLFEYEGHVWLFYEKQNLTDMKGELWAMDLDARKSPVRVLAEDFHLSYPQVFRMGKDIYMMPESREAGEVRIYRCVRFPDKWEKIKVLLPFEAVDTTLLILPPNSPSPMEAVLFSYREKHLEVYSFRLDYNFFFAGEGQLVFVTEDSLQKRPGGAFLGSDAEIFRPVQDCEEYYGRRLIFNSVRAGEDGVEEQKCCELTPEQISIKGVKAYGLHTYNLCRNIEVIDILHEETSLWVLLKKIYWKLRKN